MLHHIVREIAGSIPSAAVLDRVPHEIQILAEIDIERRHSPMALGFAGFLLHIQHPHIGVQHHHAGALKLLYARLLVADDAGSVLRAGIVHKSPEGELQDIVRRHHQHIAVD